MRPGGNPLDLNNLPEDYGRDGKQIMDESSNPLSETPDTNRCRKKKSGGKDECGKVYECRFCSLKFCKSQALGGHMNRHRQERETETLNRARQLVFSNDNIQGNPHLGYREMNIGGVQPVPPGNFTGMGDPYRSAYPARLHSTSSPSILPQPPAPTQPYLYTSSSRLMSYPSQHAPYPMSDYVVGQVINGNSHRQGAESANYTCIGAPLGRDYQPDAMVSSGEEGRQHYAAAHLNPSSINRFHHDGY